MQNFETKEVLSLRHEAPDLYLEVTRIMTNENHYTGINKITRRLKKGKQNTIFTFHGGVHKTLKSALDAYHHRRKT